MLKSLFPNDVKVNFTIDDIRLKANLIANRTIRFTAKSFFYVILGFTQSHSGPLGDIVGFVELFPGTYKSDKPYNITATDKVHIKCDCIQGSIVNGIREPFLYSLGLVEPPGHKMYNQARVKLFEKRTNKLVLSYITFYLEDDGYKPIDFNNESISFTCQINKIKESESRRNST